jgi:hypothetical protein
MARRDFSARVAPVPDRGRGSMTPRGRNVKLLLYGRDLRLSPDEAEALGRQLVAAARLGRKVLGVAEPVEQVPAAEVG